MREQSPFEDILFQSWLPRRQLHLGLGRGKFFLASWSLLGRRDVHEVFATLEFKMLTTTPLVWSMFWDISSWPTCFDVSNLDILSLQTHEESISSCWSCIEWVSILYIMLIFLRWWPKQAMHPSVTSLMIQQILSLIDLLFHVKLFREFLTNPLSYCTEFTSRLGYSDEHPFPVSICDW